MKHLLGAVALGLFASAAAPLLALTVSGNSTEHLQDTQSSPPGNADSAAPVLAPLSPQPVSGFGDSASFVLDTRTATESWIIR